MGCDIHFHVEVREGEAWRRAEPMVVPKWHPEGGPVRDDFYSDRNYSVFAMLANVRNGYGFAGLDRGDPVKPIDEPRGLPDDVSAEIRESSDEWACDGHSHSWFTLAELLAVDWQGNTVTHRGWVDAVNYDRFARFGKPSEWAGAVSGGSVRHIDNAAMAALVAAENRRTLDRLRGYHTQVEWTESWADDLGSFSLTLVRMAHVAVTKAQGDLTAVRAVFWFDN